MTCIVGVKTKEGVLLGGDSLGSYSESGTSYRAPKVFRLTRQIAVGFGTSFRMGQLIQHHLSPPTLHGDELAWAITELIPVIRDTFKAHGYANVEHNEESGGVFLLAVRGRLFKVQPDYSVLETRHPYDAAGNGEDFAIGAMHALYKPNIKPRTLLKTALTAASAFSLSVSAPYNFTSTTL